jgi:hypothetical protein
VEWAIFNRLKIFDFQPEARGFDLMPRSLAKGVAFAA